MKNKILLSLFTATTLLFSGTPAFAELFSVSAGIPISHSFTGKDSSGSEIKSDGVSGGFAHVKFPILVGVGIENYATKIKGTTETTVLATSMYDVFYLLPIPIINLTVGIGAGQTELQCATCSSTYDKGTATQWYTSLGVPFFPFFDVHLSYRSVSSKIKQSADSAKEEDVSGNVAGLGVMFSF